MRCYRCMKEYGDDLQECPHCGYHLSRADIQSYQLSPGTMIADRYWVGMVLGKGGFGITYKAFDTKLNIVVAIKEYYPVGLVRRDTEEKQVSCQSVDKEREYLAGLHRFLEEARNLARFSKNPNIVDVFHFFKENGTGYIVMEYLEGVSMKYFLRVNEGKMSVIYAKEIVLAVAKALDCLHAAGILHRDVSPDNIFLCSDGKIKLIDFGASRLSEGEDNCREVIVKPGYTPPEQYHKDLEEGPWTDIYALGATFYCAVTGCVPQEAIERQREDLLVRPGDWNEEIPAYIDSVILKAMALKARERFAHAKDMADALTQCKVVAVPRTQKERKQLRKKRIRYGACVGVLCLIIAGIAFGVVSAVPRGTLDVWLCAQEDADIEQMEKEYNQISERWTSQQYPKVKIRVHVEKAEEYQQHLMESLKAGKGPDLFESTDMADELYSYSLDLSDQANRIDQQDSYYFLSDYETYFPKRRQMPIRFDLSVVYVLQGVNDTIDVPDIPDTHDMYNDMAEQLQKFVTGQIPYLIADVSDYDVVMRAYEEQAKKEPAAGVIRIYPMENNAIRYRTVNVNADCGHNRKQLAELYLQYLMSYEGQQMLSEAEQASQELRVNCRADGEDRREIRKKLTVLEQQLENYR